MQYLISAIDPIKNSGGNKAKKDIDFFHKRKNKKKLAAEATSDIPGSRFERESDP